MSDKKSETAKMTVDQDPNRSNWAKSMALFAVIAFDLVGITLVFGGLGYLAYQYWGWPWWIAGVLALVGFTFGMIRVYFLSMRVNAGNDEKEKKTNSKDPTGPEV